MKFLVKDYTNQEDTEEAKLEMIYSLQELMEIIDEAKKENYLITIFEVKNCLLDWS